MGDGAELCVLCLSNRLVLLKDKICFIELLVNLTEAIYYVPKTKTFEQIDLLLIYINSMSSNLNKSMITLFFEMDVTDCSPCCLSY